MSIRITIFNGSPRGEKSNTHRMVEEFSAGATEAGAEVENVFLVKQQIRECLGCFACWTRAPYECRQRDDMPELLKKVEASNLVIFATPVYVDNVTGLMKTFMDRLIPLVSPYFEKDPEGEYRHQRKLARVPEIGVIANCGLPERSQFQVLELLFRRVARNLQSELVLEIYRSQGELLRADTLILKPFLARYRRALRRAGQEIVRSGRLSESTTQALDKSLVPREMYMQGANRYWDSQRGAKED